VAGQGVRHLRHLSAHVVESPVIGRDGVLDQAWRGLGADGAVLVEGPAGIGKTAVWRTLLARADQAGWAVLRCAPTESETVLPYAALADLLAPLADQVTALPRPQRVAADVVMLSGEPGGPDEPVDERAVGAAKVEFVHPVYAAAIRAAIPPGVRRRLHRRLADVAVDPDERVRYLGTVHCGAGR
jgi:hypothetical protein